MFDMNMTTNKVDDIYIFCIYICHLPQDFIYFFTPATDVNIDTPFQKIDGNCANFSMPKPYYLHVATTEQEYYIFICVKTNFTPWKCWCKAIAARRHHRHLPITNKIFLYLSMNFCIILDIHPCVYYYVYMFHMNSYHISRQFNSCNLCI